MARHRRAEPQGESKELARLQGVLFGLGGARRLPAQRELDPLLARVSQEALFWFCERQPSGPLYLLPTREFVRRLAKLLRALAGPRGTVLEVGAGDGFLSRCLRTADPGLRLRATDSGAWEKAAARLTTRADRQHAGSISGLALGAEVERLEAVAAIERYRPAVVLAAWLPPGRLFEQLARAPCRFLLDLGAGGGVTGQGEWGWRFAHDFASAELEGRARCRLDAKGARHSALTIYFGARHPDFAEERPRPGEWLHQFKSARRRARA